MECGRPSFPRDFLDTQSGRVFWDGLEAEARSARQAVSKAKRPTREGKGMRQVVESLFFSSASSGDICMQMDQLESESQQLSSSSSSSSYVVVREVNYLQAFFPPLTSHQQNQVDIHGYAVGKLQMNVCTHHSINSSSSSLSQRGGGSRGGGKQTPFNPTDIPALSSLSTNTATTVFLQAVGRGVPKQGAEIYSLSRYDYLQYLHHSSQKSKVVRADGKRFGEWRGKIYDASEMDGGDDVCDQDHGDSDDASDKSASSSSSSSSSPPTSSSNSVVVMNEKNRFMGVLTSGGMSYVTGNRIGLGVCVCDTLYEYLREAAVFLPTVIVPTTKKKCFELEDALGLVLFKNVGSNQMRVARVHPLASP